MSNINAAIGLAEFENMKIHKTKKNNFNEYQKLFYNYKFKNTQFSKLRIK